ncbi:MAG: hypothetical protein U1A78_21520 [Polyangia bacterium]
MLILAGLAGLTGLAACSEAPDSSSQALTYHGDIAPLVERYCGGCHVAGGIAPFPLGSYAEVSRYAMSVRSAVASGSMPPWMPSADSRPLHGSRAMRTQDKEQLLRWIDEGLQEGDPTRPPRTDLPPADPPTAPRPDLVLDPGWTYTPQDTRDDDYHCFLFDPKLSADRFMVAGDVRPGNPRIVHHVIAYEILEADAAAIRAKDPDGKGYTCFGAPGTSGPPTTLLGWAPGSPGSRMPEGTALRLHKGSLIVVQVHYNVLYGPGQGDRTVMSFELTDTPPARELYALPLARPKMLKIPAGAADAVQTIEVPLSALTTFFKLPSNSLTVYAHTPHMHLLGRRITTWLNGQLVLDLPRWDYHWQQAYQFQEPYQAKGTDVLKLECRYDNTAANQPVINGQQQAPRDVTWGEGTLDEMCLNYVLLSAQ